MSAPAQPTGDEHGSRLLERISNEMVRAQKRFFGKGPEEAKSYLQRASRTAEIAVQRA